MKELKINYKLPKYDSVCASGFTFHYWPHAGYLIHSMGMCVCVCVCLPFHKLTREVVAYKVNFYSVLSGCRLFKSAAP